MKKNILLSTLLGSFCGAMLLSVLLGACSSPSAILSIGLTAAQRETISKNKPRPTTLFVDDFDVLYGLDNSNVVAQKEGAMQFTTLKDAQWLSTPSDMIQSFMTEYLSHKLSVVHVQDPKPEYIVSGKVTQLSLLAGNNKKIDSLQVGIHIVLQRYDTKNDRYYTAFSQMVSSKKHFVAAYTTNSISSTLSQAFGELAEVIAEKVTSH